MKSTEERVRNFLLPFVFGVLALVLWQVQFFHVLLNLKVYQLPLPSDICVALSQNTLKALGDCAVTISGALVGLVLGSAFGFGIAMLATFFPKWGYGGMILVSALNAIPIVALSPIMNRWFSNGMSQKVGVVTIVCMAAMAMNAYAGLNTLKPFSLDLMHMAAASKWTIFRKLRLPNCLPYVFTACKINIASSIIAAIISEYFAASTAGLGFGIKNYLRMADMANGWAYIVVASIAGVALYGIITLVERNAIKWHASQR